MYCMYGMLKRSIRRGNDLPVDRAICRRMCTGRSARRPQGSTMRSITRIRLAASERISGRSCSACTSGARETNCNAPPGASARGPHRDAPSRTAAGRGSPSSIARARSTRGRVAQTADGRRRRGEGKENRGQTLKRGLSQILFPPRHHPVACGDTPPRGGGDTLTNDLLPRRFGRFEAQQIAQAFPEHDCDAVAVARQRA